MGGTFTDFSVFNQETGELFIYQDRSTPSDQSRAILQVLRAVLELRNASPEESITSVIRLQRSASVQNHM